jgi:hypothetical protein
MALLLLTPQDMKRPGLGKISTARNTHSRHQTISRDWRPVNKKGRALETKKSNKNANNETTELAVLFHIVTNNCKPGGDKTGDVLKMKERLQKGKCASLLSGAAAPSRETGISSDG